MSSRFISKLHSGLITVKRWEEEDLLLACRKEIPLAELCPEQYIFPSTSDDDRDAVQASPYVSPDDYKYQGDDLLLQRLANYFKSMMTWVNNPPCELCGSKETKGCASRGPMTPEEHNGDAQRVEVYFCQICNAETTTFPRYNNPMKILETKKGRCGEYANLFGAFCRSLGFETRYVLDFTDHVWVEVFSNATNRWIMADGCEGKIDEESMYEKGWGKELCYNIAFSTDSVADVTKRYTRKFLSPQFQARRRNFSPAGESQSDALVAQFNIKARNSQKLSSARIEELDQRQKAERYVLEQTLKQESWGNEAYNVGRLSGSLVWRVSRGEAGNTQPTRETDKDTETMANKMYHVECFHPMPYQSKECSIVISSPCGQVQSEFTECIRVMDTPCGSGIPNTISIVVVDEKNSCILQSRVFKDWIEASNFICRLPDERIVAIYSDVWIDGNCDTLAFVKSKLCHLGNFDSSILSSNCDNKETYFFYVGQVYRNNTWASSQRAEKGTTMCIHLDLKTDASLSGFKLQRRIAYVPQVVSMRLPDDIMSLQAQMVASEKEKLNAFLRFMQSENLKQDIKKVYVGFVTKDGVPVYLISKEAFPFKKSADSLDSKETWITYSYVPEPMWYEEEKKSNDDKSDSNIDVPVDDGFFTALLGTTLLKNDNYNQTETSTVAELANTRLVAFYFSAHWCGPCRKFTPHLCEMYSHLKSVYPSHGLEIVFVSSDRDDASFVNYFRSMPWLSVPWNGEGQALRQKISQRFGIQGIPALVVIDSISGNVVVSKEQSRSEIMTACQRGESAIETLLKGWLDRIPVESKNMMDILKLSCGEDMDCDENQVAEVESLYLVRSEPITKSPQIVMSKDDQVTKIREYFDQLVAEGAIPNQAAKEAILRLTKELSTGLLFGSIKGNIDPEYHYQPKSVSNMEEIRVVLDTAKKYIDNARKKPYTSKFRGFKLSNRFFDNITKTEGGLEFVINDLKFSVHNIASDFIVCIPLSIDIDALSERVDEYLK